MNEANNQQHFFNNMNNRKIYVLIFILLAGLTGLYYYNKYKVAPKIDLTKLEIINADSTRFDFSSLKGNKVIICFYASWCGNCLDEMKTLNKIKDTKLSDVTILAVTDESMEKLISFRDRKQYPFTFLKLNVAFKEIGINSIPVVYLMNTSGNVVYESLGYVNWEDESTLNHLKNLME